MGLVVTACLTLGLVVACAALHYETLHIIGRHARPRDGRWSLMAVVVLLLALHLAEIALFGVGYWLGDRILGLGDFAGARTVSGEDYFYFASETYTSLGYGDVYPVGDLRMLAGANTLAGLLLLAWSGAFLFALLEEWRLRGVKVG